MQDKEYITQKTDKQKTNKKIALTGIVSALYIVLSLITFPVASGNIQFRISEGLTLLPLLFPESVISLFVGCFITNLITGCALFDCVIGSIVSLLSGVLTFIMGKVIKGKVKRIILGGVFPVLLNAFLLPLVWLVCYGVDKYAYIVQVGFILISQCVSVYIIGGILINKLDKFILTK